MKTKTWIAVLAAVFLICAAVSAALLLPGEAAARAEIWSEGTLVATVELDTDRVLTVEGSNGTNVITVSGGKIAVTEADCPDHVCMDRGFCDSGTPIVCLPNKLVIEFVGQEAVDGAVG